ncbi:unnamed protein product [Rotaria socialis]|uniref:Uncharacterized protein n=1 Tax=Rotaria socialis TaxID=392032 RepID=A0A820JLR1_9BILA|nr:unnamed protein product [Rotaria socialis]CAF4359966.1 unnamed protein product [Rotaria socialis]CAF4473936.1 unnamed protein product [Rotaria socialis]CAF4673620.1 unnamed protein product [Rotaria socialis]CAF4831597.1 unnamed protein product [Rotaria socialis]
MISIQQLFIRRTCLALLIFLLCLITYCYYDSENNYIPINIILNEYYSIEKHLEKIQNCTSEDHFRQRILLTMFHAWSHFTDIHNIQYWVAYETLVGYIQRRENLIPFSDAYFSSVYEIKLYIQRNVVGYTNRSYHQSQGINFVAPNARFIHRKLHLHIDIRPIYDYHPNHLRNTTKIIKTLTEYSRSGIKVWCPAMPEKLVNMLYGIETFNKTDTTCINGTWAKI